ncbi:MAG TPA: hypothetical protein VN643_03345 [Pyrinomonadaceae bacterium]|nr:hypothetical protein [Pyrinomonadaceae bacterium]
MRRQIAVAIRFELNFPRNEAGELVVNEEYDIVSLLRKGRRYVDTHGN